MKEVASKTIMIAGGGRIGRRLAESLEGRFDLKIIELNKDRCIYLSEKLDTSLILNGDSSDSALLEEENIEKTDFFCSVTDDDEANVMSSMLAKKMGAKKSLSLVIKVLT
jgi:trk system potassium uptake protein TrkA